MDKETTRAEHLEWCKRRALEYCKIGDINQALASMGSDLNKHIGTTGHFGVVLGLRMIMDGNITTPAQMEKFIRGFR